jgi:predicted transcriptional regulator
MASQSGLSDAERAVLRVLWERGPGTVRVIREALGDQGRTWAYTTVATLLQRLQVKQYVTADSSVVPHVYHAAVSREELLVRRLKDTAEEFCDGQVAPLLLSLVQKTRFSTEELDRLRQLLDSARRQAGDDTPGR